MESCRGPAVPLDADFTEAERLLMLADCHTRAVTYAQKWTLTLTAAQVHATLALAAATAVGTAGPDVHAWADVAATMLATTNLSPRPRAQALSRNQVWGWVVILGTGVLVRHCTSPLKLACASYLTDKPDVQS